MQTTESPFRVKGCIPAGSGPMMARRWNSSVPEGSSSERLSSGPRFLVAAKAFCSRDSGMSLEV